MSDDSEQDEQTEDTEFLREYYGVKDMADEEIQKLANLANSELNRRQGNKPLSQEDVRGMSDGEFNRLMRKMQNEGG